MSIYPLTSADKTIRGEWMLDGDGGNSALVSPDGQVVAAWPVGETYQIFDLTSFHWGEQLRIATAEGVVAFKRDEAAVRGLRSLVLHGLARDAEFRHGASRRYMVALVAGIVMAVICGGLFGGYCWWASVAADPPPGHWLHTVGGLIRFGLIMVGGLFVRGLFKIYWAVYSLGVLRDAALRSEAMYG